MSYSVPTDHYSDPPDYQQRQAECEHLRQENQRLYGEVQQLVKTEQQLYHYQQQLDQQINTYQKLYQLSKTFTQSRSLETLFQHVLEFALYELNFERSLIFLLDEPTEKLELQAFDGYYDAADRQQLTGLQIPLYDRSLLTLTTGTDHLVFPAATTKESTWQQTIALDEAIVFSLRRDDQQPIGLLIVGNTEAMWHCHSRVQDNHQVFLGLANLSSHTAAAIDNIQAYQALSIQKSLLEERVTERTATLRQQNHSLAETLDQLQQTQAKLVQSEKMSSLGQMVAGVAHEINNPVTFIYGNIRHARSYAEALFTLLNDLSHQLPHNSIERSADKHDIDLEFIQKDLPKLFDSMEVGAQRVQDIVLSLRNFARMDEAEYKIVDLHPGIDSTLSLMEHRLKVQSDRPKIKVEKVYRNLPAIECYAGELNQVFMNILANAIDALDQAYRTKQPTHASQQSFHPTIQIETQHIVTDIGSQVQIKIGDNGIGIESHIKDQIFNPFFTTKPVGSGTGMGLPISYQIITQQHQGSIDCHSVPGQGTAFTITLPIQSTINAC